jgi:hypothetical protein
MRSIWATNWASKSRYHQDGKIFKILVGARHQSALLLTRRFSAAVPLQPGTASISFAPDAKVFRRRAPTASRSLNHHVKIDRRGTASINFVPNSKVFRRRAPTASRSLNHHVKIDRRGTASINFVPNSKVFGRRAPTILPLTRRFSAAVPLQPVAIVYLQPETI